MSPPYRRRRILLAIGVAAPILALVAVLAAVLAYPGFDHARQYLSDLGGPKARYPMIFNAAILVTGFGAAAAGVGFGLALLALGGSRIAAALVTAAFALAGYGMVVSTFYPWPDPRHLAIRLGLFILIAPPMLIWGIARVEGLSVLRRFLVGVTVAMVVLAVLTDHIVLKGLVNDANVGWWERAFAIVLVGWTGVAAFALERRLVRLTRD